MQIAAAAAMSLLVFVPLLRTVVREQRKQPTVIGRLADRMAARTDLPRWLVLPFAVDAASILLAGIGVYWDVPIHVDLGRDEGPLANPSHYLILFGLLGTFASGVLVLGLARKDLPRRTVRLGPGWRVPMGGVLVTFSGMVALSGFPLDDIWHRLFGQDVTEWGPTHVLMIGGSVVSILGFMLLSAEARQVVSARRASAARAGDNRWLKLIEQQSAALWLLGISSLLMEFEVGVPQFPIVSQATIFALITTWAFVYARTRLGPGGALGIFAVYLLSRLLMLTLQNTIWDVSSTTFLLYLGEAVLVELVALAVGTDRKYRFGLLSGIAIGTLGFLAEWPWTHLFMPMPWPDFSIPTLIGYALVGGVGGGLIVGWQLTRLDATSAPVAPQHESQTSALQGFSRRHAAGVAGGLVAVIGLVISIPPTAETAVSAEVGIEEVDTSEIGDVPIDGRAGYLTVTLSDPDVVEEAMWFYAQAWQGGGMIHTDLVEVGDGVYRTEDPLPLYGTWKTMIRLALLDRELVNLPVFLPEDTAIPAPELAAVDGMTREFVTDKQVLMREQRTDVPGWLWTLGYVAVFAIYLALFAAMAGLYVRSATASPVSTGNRGPDRKPPVDKEIPA